MKMSVRIILLRFVLFAAVLFLIPKAFSQNFPLGWSGSPIIPSTVWSDKSQWNSGAAPGDQIIATHTNNEIQLHWKFGPGNRAKWVVYYLRLKTPIAFHDTQIIGIDVKGTLSKKDNRDFSFKFEDGTSQGIFLSHGLAAIDRWVNRISVLKKQANGSPNWNKINVIAFAISSDPSANDLLADSGTVCIRNLQVANIAQWERTSIFDTLPASPKLDTVRQETLNAILGRQVANGLFYTWREDNCSWLYGHGLVLKLLSLEGIWDNGKPMNASATAAEKLAHFIANQQNSVGFWPRAWNTKQGTVRFTDEYIWFGDFPWMITGLVNYNAKSGDAQVLPSIYKAQKFLYSLIEPSGRVNTVNSTTGAKQPVTSTEAYAAVIQSVYELGDTMRARILTEYIQNYTWENGLKYYKEAIYSYRPTLFSNTWMAMLRKSAADSAKALDALSFAAKSLNTRGDGKLNGFDGFGPVATWLEGTLSYICAGGPNSNMLFDNLLQLRYPDGSVPSYSDSLGGKGDVWAVTWSSLDATAWLYYVSARKSPFKKYVEFTSPLNLEIPQKMDDAFVIFPNPGSGDIVVKRTGLGGNVVSGIRIYSVSGVQLFSWRAVDEREVIFGSAGGERGYSEHGGIAAKHGQETFSLDVSALKSGIYFFEMTASDGTVQRLKWVKD